MTGGILSGCANNEHVSIKTNEGTTTDTELENETDVMTEGNNKSDNNESDNYEHCYTWETTKEPVC